MDHAVANMIKSGHLMFSLILFLKEWEKKKKSNGFRHDGVKWMTTALACNPMLPSYRAA